MRSIHFTMKLPSGAGTKRANTVIGFVNTKIAMNSQHYCPIELDTESGFGVYV